MRWHLLATALHPKHCDVQGLHSPGHGRKGCLDRSRGADVRHSEVEMCQFGTAKPWFEIMVHSQMLSPPKEYILICTCVYMKKLYMLYIVIRILITFNKYLVKP